MSTAGSTTGSTATRYDEAAIEADPTVPMIHIWRDFAGTPEQLFRAHTDPELFARWIGPEGMGATILEWDATNNGKWRYAGGDRNDQQQFFRGSFHTVSPEKIVQTFTWEGMPDAVALETVTFEDRDMWLRESGMEIGVEQGYAALDRMLADGSL